MQINQQSTEFKEQALSKTRQRGTRTLEWVATELNLSLGTLKTWIKMARRNQACVATPLGLPSKVAARQRSAAQRLLALGCTKATCCRAAPAAHSCRALRYDHGHGLGRYGIRGRGGPDVPRTSR